MITPLIFCAFLATFAPDNPQLDLHLRPRQSFSIGAGELVLKDPATGTERLRQKIEVPWRGGLALERPFAGLQVELDSPTLWSAPLLVPEAAPEGIQNMDVFQRGELVFTEDPALPPGAAPPPAAGIEVEVAGAPAPREKDLLKKTRLACRLEEGRWHCPAPALVLDLRLEKLDHVPRYFFGLRVEPGKSLDLGRLRFEKGASISGYVTVEEGEPRGVAVSLAPSGSDSPHDGHRQDLRKLEGLANERGFFQVRGVAPGGYRLEAGRQGLATTELWPVEVLEGKETSLAAPIFLTRAAELEVHVSPATGPLGKPWKLRLIRNTPDAAGNSDVLAAETDAGGAAIWRDLRPGSHVLFVSNPDGEKTATGEDSIWASRFLDLQPGSQTLFQDIATVRVEGEILAGDEPIRGRLIFGGNHGSPQAVVWSDEQGQFEGQLPRAGLWDLDAEIDGRLLSLAQVEVEPRGGRPARLEIHLPDTRFHGIVTHRGKRVAGAELWGLSTESGKSLRFDTATDGEGAFDLRGLAAGTYRVTVSSARLRLAGPRLQFDIREGAESSEVEIELEAYRRLEGQILANGAPVPLASFGVFFRSQQGDDIQQGQGDAAGVLRVGVPESTRELAMVVSAAGFAWQVLPLRPGASTADAAPFFVEAAQNGGTLEVESPDPAATRILTGGVEIPLHLVVRTLQTTGNASLADGRWVLTNAAPGVYGICSGGRCTQGVLSAGGNLDLAVSFSTAAVLASN